ncbi:MAG: T9SS type A sorting domain-containing protein [Bacteroidota bacterium]
MKKVILSFLIILSYISSYGQCNQGACQSIQNVNIANGQNWSPSHGSPTWGNNSVWLWSYTNFNNNTVGEGVNYSGFNFQQGLQYCVSFTLNATTNTGQAAPANNYSMNVILTQNAINGNVSNTSGGTMPNIPAGSQQIMNQNIWANGGGQQVYAFTFTANQNYGNMIFFPRNPNRPQPQIEVSISNMSICTLCNNNASPAFDIEISCDNGNKCVTVTSNDPNIPNHSWELMEIASYSSPNDTSDANTVDLDGDSSNGITAEAIVTGQNSATFCWLDLSKRYYIKHGIWDDNCYGWREVRTPVPNFEATAAFHFEDEDTNIKTEFCYGEDVYLNGLASQGENRYFIDAWRRPIGSTQDVDWYAGLGWTTNATVPVLNLSQEFANNGNPRYFEPGYEYEIKLAVMNLQDCIGWTPITHTFTVVCCDDFLDASFHSQQATTGNIEILSFDLYDNVNATHEWYIMSSPNQNGGPYTPVLSTTTTGSAPHVLTLNAQSGLFYTVVHKVVTLCGEICSANVHYFTKGESLVRSESYAHDIKNSCELVDEVFTDCLAATRLRYNCRHGVLSWSGDPSLTYIVEVNWDDSFNCRNCKGKEPRSIRREVRGTSFRIEQYFSSCFSWRIGTKCEDEVVWTDYHCSDCFSLPHEEPHEPVDVETTARISPNPNDGNMNIEISGKDKTDFTLKVYRFDGVLIKSFGTNRIENKLSTIAWNGRSVLTPGMYFFVITTDSETITKKVIIE